MAIPTPALAVSGGVCAHEYQYAVHCLHAKNATRVGCWETQLSALFALMDDAHLVDTHHLPRGSSRQTPGLGRRSLRSDGGWVGSLTHVSFNLAFSVLLDLFNPDAKPKRKWSQNVYQTICKNI